ASPFSAPRYAFNAPEWLTCFLRMRLRFTPTSMPATGPRSFYISQNFPMATIGGTELPPRLDERTSQHKMKKYLCLLILLSLAIASVHGQSETTGDYWVYFGTYTGFTYMKEGLAAGGSRSKGIYVSRFHPATGELSRPALAAEITNPAFLAIHPNHRFL